MQNPNSIIHVEASARLAAGGILSMSGIAAWLSWDGRTIDRSKLEDLALRVEIVYEYCASGEVHKIVLDGVNRDWHMRYVEGDEFFRATVGSIRVDDDLVAEVIAGLKTSDSVVTMGRKNRNHLQVAAVQDATLKLSILNKDRVLMGYAWVEKRQIHHKGTGLPSFDYVVQRVEKWSDKCASLRRVVYATLTNARFGNLIAAG